MIADKTFRLTKQQQLANTMLAGPERHMALVGGARSGKTFLAVRTIVMRALLSDGSRHAIFRFRENAVHRSIANDTLPAVMRKCFDGVALIKRPEFYMLPNKSEIWLGGLDEKERTERVLGQEFVTIYFNECSQIKYAAVLIALTRLAQVCYRTAGPTKGRMLPQRAIYDLNPLGRGHWTNIIFGDKRDPVSRQPLRNPDNYARLFMNPYDNKENLTADFIESLESMPERQRKRFLEGKYVDEWENALWTYEGLERCRTPHPGDDAFKRVVVAVDPSGSDGEVDSPSNDIGVVVAALGQDGHAYVLADWTCNESPGVWGRRVSAAAEKFKADCVVAEKNFGGDMVRFVLKTANPKLNVKVVTASRGKVARAEPISALYGDEHSPVLVHHVDRFPMLEEEMCSFTTNGYMGESSPNRGDALVWALTELMLTGVRVDVIKPLIITAPKIPYGTIDAGF